MRNPPTLPSRLRLATLGLALSLAAGVAGAQVFSQPDNDFRGAVRATSPVVLPGNEIELAGMGFKPGQAVTLLRGETALNTTPYVADAEGRFTANVRIPQDAATGRHPVVVRVANPDAAAVFDLKISREVPLSGQDAFEVASNPLVPGLYQVAYSAASDALFVTSAVGRPPVTQSELVRVDPQSLEITARVTPARVEGRDDGGVYAVYGVGVDDANGNVWVTNTRQNTVAVYRQSDLSLVRQLPDNAVPHPMEVFIDTAHQRAYVTANGGEFVSVFDARTFEQLDNITIRSSQRGETFRPTGMALDEVGGKLFVAGLSTGELAVIDTGSSSVEKVIALPNARGSFGVAWNRVDNRVLVVSQGSDNLLIVDPATGNVEHDVYIGAGALNVAFDAQSGLAFVLSRGAGTVTAVNSAGQIVGNLDGGTFPNHAFADGRGTVYTVNKARGADDPQGDHIRRISPKSR